VACTITQNTSTSTQEKGADFTLKLGEMVFKDKKITWSPEPSKTSENMLEAHYDEYKDQTITVTIDGKTCSFVPKEDQGKSNEDSGYGITISQTSSNSTQSDFKAVIKKDDKELEGIPEGYDVIWYTYDAGTAPKKEEKPASSYDEFDSPSSS